MHWDFHHMGPQGGGPRPTKAFSGCRAPCVQTAALPGTGDRAGDLQVRDHQQAPWPASHSSRPLKGCAVLKEGTARAWIVPGHRVAHGLPVCSGVLALAHSKHRTDNGTAVLVGVLPNAGGMCGAGLQGGSPRPPSLGLTPTCGQLLRWHMPWTQPPLLAESNCLRSETRGLKGLCGMTQQGSQPCPLPVGPGGWRCQEGPVAVVRAETPCQLPALSLDCKRGRGPGQRMNTLGVHWGDSSAWVPARQRAGATLAGVHIWGENQRMEGISLCLTLTVSFK